MWHTSIKVIKAIYIIMQSILRHKVRSGITPLQTGQYILQYKESLNNFVLGFIVRVPGE